MAAADVQDVKAWLVAVESYADPYLDPGIEIGQRAVALATLLAAKGVPSANIAVSISPLEPYRPRLAPLAAFIGGTSPNDLLRAVDFVSGGKLLLVYWIGHGVKDASSFWVLSGDSKYNDFQSVDINRLMARLRSARFARTQFAFFDCCAEFVHSVGNQFLPGVDNEKETVQFCAYASSSAQRTTAALTADSFSGALLHTLSHTLFPFDPPVVFNAFRSRLEDLRKAGVIDSGPQSIFLTEDPAPGRWSLLAGAAAPLLDELDLSAKLSGDTPGIYRFLLPFALHCSSLKDTAWPLPAGLLAPAPDIVGNRRAASILYAAMHQDKMPELLSALRGIHRGESPFDTLDGAWPLASIVKSFLEPSRRLGLLWNQWISVARRTLQIDLLGELPPLESLDQLQMRMIDYGLVHFARFLILASQQVPPSGLAVGAALRAAIKAHPVLANVYGPAEQRIPQDRLRLQIALEYDRNAKAASIECAWLRRESEEKGALVAIPEAASVALQIWSLIEQAQADGCSLVEILAPLDLLCMPRNLLCVEGDMGSWLEQDYPIVLRWHERLKVKFKDPRYKYGTWLELSNRVRAALLNSKKQCAWFATDQSVKVDDDCQVVGLSYHRDLNRNKFSDDIRTGGPYMCWPRAESLAAAAQTAAGRLFERYDRRDWPHRFSDERKAGDLAEVVLFLDEPEFDPYASGNFQIPSQQGEPK